MLIPLVLVSLILLASACRDDGHYFITFKNLSNEDVYLCLLTTVFDGSSNKCGLGRFHILEKNSVFEWQPFRFSFERELGSSRELELFIVNPKKFNPPHPFDCDSIFIKNDVLKHLRLTLEDLQRMDFTITFP